MTTGKRAERCVTHHKEESWLPICGYEGRYEVSTLGRVRSLPILGDRRTRNKIIILKQCYRLAYPRVLLWKNGSKKAFSVHRLVAVAFIPNPYDKPQVNHIDNDKLNSNSDNLEWSTQSENIKHSFLGGFRTATKHFGHSNGRAKLTKKGVEHIRLLAGSLKPKHIASIYGVSESNVRMILRGKTWATV